MKKKIPKRRFKEFINSGEWEEKKLGEVADRFDNLRIPIAESKRIAGITPYYGANGIVDYVDGYTHNGEFVLIAEDGANDLNNYPIHYVNGEVWVNNHAHVIQGINNILENVFLVYCLKTIDISSYLVGGSRAKLNADTMMKLNILIPSLPEQKKIGNFFEKLDRLIDLNREKLEKLKNIKSAYLSEMFPKEGELYPKRRFSGFTKPWEEKKLGDIAMVTDYVAAGSFADIAKNVIYLNEVDYAQLIRTVDIKHNFKNGNFIYVDKTGFEFLWRVNLEKESIILPNIGANIGEVYHLLPSNLPNDRNVLGPNAILLRSIQNMTFLFNLFNTIRFQTQLSLIIASSGQPKFNKTELKQINISIPSRQEQEKIGNFFKKLDERIILQEKKIEKLENMKKAYLSEMFV